MANEEVGTTFESTVQQGEYRLGRSWPALLATGVVGGIDLGTGVLALLLVLHETGNILLGSVAFSIGFIALMLAGSELFTENFLVPIAAVAAGRARVASLVRLWGGTLAMNLVGGWIVAALIIAAFPHLRPEAIDGGLRYLDLGTGWVAFASALLGGAAITLMTWMEQGTSSAGARVVVAVAIGFLLAAGPLNHIIVGSLEMFTALVAGAPFGYLDWLRVMAWAGLGNAVGGIGLVTALRLVQVGRERIEET